MESEAQRTAKELSDEIKRLRDALTKIRTAGYNWDATAVWMQKVAASALEPGKWPDAGEQPASRSTAGDGHGS